jgi:VWFA-related protein
MREQSSVVAILLAAAVLAQTQTAPTPPAGATAVGNQIPLFRAVTRLVQVNVLVHDRHGEPVTDLKKEDFTIVERGKPQRITFFAMESATSPATPPPLLPRHIFTNVLVERGDVPTGITVILLDLLNTSWGDQHYAREALVKFLAQVQPKDRIAIYALGARSLTLLHDYTTDAASLVARMDKVKGQTSPELDASTLNPDTQQELRNLDLGGLADANEREADFFASGRVVNTLQALEAVAEHLSGLPGRKNLIWLSGGFPLTIGMDEIPAPGSTREQRTFTHEMDAAVRALNNSGVAVYPVDARGLMVLPGFDASVRGAARIGPGAAPKLAPLNANIDTMRELADRTGGRAAYNSNDLARAIRRAIDDGRVTYTLGFYSSDETQDGKFRDIKVSVNRPGMDVRYRKGYFALRPADKTAESRKQDVRAAVWSPLESTAIAINARVDFVDQPPPPSVNVFVQIDPSTVSFKKEGDRWKAQLDIVYVQKDERGVQQGDGMAEQLTLALTEDNYTKVTRQGLIHQRRFPRQSKAVTLRIVVRDAESGSVGSLTVPFTQVSPTDPRH